MSVSSTGVRRGKTYAGIDSWDRHEWAWSSVAAVHNVELGTANVELGAAV